jgi:hypothetical protein
MTTRRLTESELEDAAYECDLHSDVFHGTNKTNGRGLLIRAIVEVYARKPTPSDAGVK